jgi:hypothetical protein
MSEQTVSEELAEEMSIEDALEYLRHQPQFAVVVQELERRKVDIELGMGAADQGNALRLCGSLSESQWVLSMLKGE